MSIINIKPPLCITSRLRCGCRIGESELSIAYDKWTDDGRQQYHYWLDLKIDDRRIEFYGDDLASGVGGGSLQQGLESLLSFLAACGESYAYAMRHNNVGGMIDLSSTENGELFPENVAEWCYLNSDELGMLAIELEESDNLIEE